jgi:hypothetical protein
VRCPDRDPEDVSRSVERLVEIQVKDEDRAVIEGQPPEREVELIAIDDRPIGVCRRLAVDRKGSKVPRVSPLSTDLGVARTDEKAVRPRLEANWVTQLRQEAPRVEKALLRRVLGEVEVAQDAAGYCQERLGQLARD